MASLISFPRTTPYNDLPLLPPKAEVETKRTLKLAIKARAALSDLKGTGKLIPSQAMLVRAIVLQEAKLSSEIENIVTTNDDLYKAMSKDSLEGNPHTKEVLRYGEAVWTGFYHLERNGLMTPNLFSKLATVINDVDTDVRKLSGTRIANPNTKEIVYSPLEGEDSIRRLLHNLCEFLHDEEDDIDPLIKLAIAHYQFEAIHPFPDGNGRTGRVLNILFLIERALLEIPVLYLSRYIIQNKSEYYRGLRSVTEEGAWEDWVSYMLQAIENTAIETRIRIQAIHEAMSQAKDIIKQAAPKMYSHELVEVIFSQPYTRISFLEEKGLAKRQTASSYLKRLEELGLMVSVKVWRETLYLNPKLMELLAA
jgi:Fic family protein